jgi:hypothetical protein
MFTLFQNYQLAYPWLIIMKMTLIGELCFIIKMYSKNRCKPSAAHLFNFGKIFLSIQQIIYNK